MSDVFLSAPVLPVLASAPASPTNGMAYIRDSDYHVLVYDGAAWVDQAAGSSVLKQTAVAEVTANTTTTSTSMVTLLTQSITTGAGFLDITFTWAASRTSGTSAEVRFQLIVDGIIAAKAADTTISSRPSSGGLSARVPVAAGAHVVEIQWSVASSTGQIRPTTAGVYEHACMICREVSA